MSQKKNIEHEGIVEDVVGNKVKVKIVSESACAACHAKDACTSADKKDKLVDVTSTTHQFKIGQPVLLIGNQSLGLKAVLYAYVLPFVLILLVLMVAHSFTHNEALSGILALIALFPYYIALSFFSKKLKQTFSFTIKPIIQ